MTRGEILEKVYKQIKEDVDVCDYSAIEELLTSVSIENLIEFLPEGN